MVKEHDDLHLPLGDHVQDLRALVDAAIVHDNDRVRRREVVHLVEQTINKTRKANCIE
jgi:hypothetical protein